MRKNDVFAKGFQLFSLISYQNNAMNLKYDPVQISIVLSAVGLSSSINVRTVNT
jgi:hypothetical protein